MVGDDDPAGAMDDSCRPDRQRSIQPPTLDAAAWAVARPLAHDQQVQVGQYERTADDDDGMGDLFVGLQDCPKGNGSRLRDGRDQVTGIVLRHRRALI